jgi:hypothetical protein
MNEKFGKRMKKRFKLIAHVKAINSKGETGSFELVKPVDKEIEPTKKENELFFGEKFKGRIDDKDPTDFIVVEVKRIECVPEPFYISVVRGLESNGRGFIKLGDYDNSDSEIYYKKSPLTGLTVSFELGDGEGLVFNKRDRFGWTTKSNFRWTKSDYIVTRWDDEIWTFPKSDWDLHISSDPSIDYQDPDSFRDSLPELSCY